MRRPNARAVACRWDVWDVGGKQKDIASVESETNSLNNSKGKNNGGYEVNIVIQCDSEKCEVRGTCTT